MHYKIYLRTENYICALKNMPVMYYDQYLSTEIVICALHIWATVHSALSLHFLANVNIQAKSHFAFFQILLFLRSTCCFQFLCTEYGTV